MREMLEHPEIGRIERTGYPSFGQSCDEDYDREFWGEELAAYADLSVVLTAHVSQKERREESL